MEKEATIIAKNVHGSQHSYEKIYCGQAEQYKGQSGTHQNNKIRWLASKLRSFIKLKLNYSGRYFICMISFITKQA